MIPSDLSIRKFMNNSFHINSLPVYWRVKEPNTVKHPKIPERLDISIKIDQENGVLSQVLSNEIKSTLLDIYSEDENIGYLRDDNKLAIGYHNDLFNFIKKQLSKFHITEILEIGCGGCTILKELKSLGYKVTGIDPSPFAQKCAEEKGINIIQEFFRPDLINKNYDLVYFSDVLEHVFDPTTFLRNLSDSLCENSIIIIAVPDATTESISGDYSMLMHQHISYFTELSLKKTILRAGLSCISIQKAGYGGSLYAVCEVKSKQYSITYTTPDNANTYFNLALKTRENFYNLFDKLENNYSRILCYVPLRAIPYLTSINKLDSEYIEFLDDTPFWSNNVIDGTNKLIQPLSSHKINHEDCVLIFSNTFDKKIRDKVISYSSDKNLSIYSIKDFTAGK